MITWRAVWPRPCKSSHSQGRPGSGDVRSLVLRAWLEPGASPHLRARVVEITPGRGERPVVVTTSVDEACRAVRNWLETLLAQEPNDNGDGTVTRRG
jgi:hypothetical protein